MYGAVELYSEIPSSDVYVPESAGERYLDTVVRVARLSEAYGFRGSLVYYNHHILDPWTVAMAVLQHTSQLVPLVALQPYTMPPFTAAKLIQSAAYIYGRRLSLNMIAGAKEAELRQIHDPTPHDARYERIGEYVQMLRALLHSERPVNGGGRFYPYSGLRLEPLLPAALTPDIFMSGSSAASIAAARESGAVAVTHPGPLERFRAFVQEHYGEGRLQPLGMRVGLIARSSRAEAWRYAESRYEITRRSELHTRLKMQSESVWNRQLAELALQQETYDGVYWLGGFKSGAEFNPILVGDYEEVAAYVRGYMDLGVTRFIVNNLCQEADYEHAAHVFRLASAPEFSEEERNVYRTV